MIGVCKESFNGIEKYKKQIEKCLTFIEQREPLEQLKTGKYEIEDDNIFVNIVEYETKQEKETYWEAHRQYLDLHYIISGTEKICVGDLKEMELIDFIEEQDFVKVAGDKYAEIIMKEGNFLFLDTVDVHKTGIKDMNVGKVKRQFLK